MAFLHSLSFRNCAVVIFGVFLSPSEHSLLLSVISGDSVPVFCVPSESVQCNTLQTTTKLTCSTTRRVLFFSRSPQIFFQPFSWSKSFSYTWDVMNPSNQQLPVLRQGSLPVKQRESSQDDNFKFLIHSRAGEIIHPKAWCNLILGVVYCN